MDNYIDRKCQIAALLTLTLFWLVLHPYPGLVHDARLYAFLAAARLDPANLGNDVFVRFGSQGDWTAFTWLHALALEQWGLDAATRWLTLAGQLAWMLAAISLVVQVVGRSQRILAFACLVLLPGTYAMSGLLAYAEPFLTPRLFAEAAALVALAFACGKRPLPAIAALVVSTAMHPLVAAPAALASLLILAPRRGIQLLAMGFLGLVALLATQHLWPIGPFALMDPGWLNLVRSRSEYLFLDLWDAADWGRAIWPISVCAAMLLVPDADSRLHSLSRGVLVASIAGLAVAAVASAWPAILLVQGQAWRVLWMTQVTAAVLLWPLLTHLWVGGSMQRLAALWIVSAWLLPPAAGSVALMGVLLLWRGSGLGAPTRRALGGLTWTCVMLGAWTWGSAAYADWLTVPGGTPTQEVFQFAGVLASKGIAPVALVAFCMQASLSRAWWLPILGTLGCLSLTCLAEARARWATPLLNSADAEAAADWSVVIPRGATVYWPDGAPRTWFILNRPSYSSRLQAAGLLFSRDASVEMARRATALLPLEPTRSSLLPPDGPVFKLVPSVDGYRAACRDTELGYVVSPRPLGLPEASAPLVLSGSLGTQGTFHLYGCMALRASGEQG